MPPISESGNGSRWSRLVVEGLVIVVSILLAFAIDAWWDTRQERQAEARQLARVAAELTTNAGLTRDKLEVLMAARDAASRFIGWMGPEPTPVSQEEFDRAFRTMYSIGFFRLQRSALDDLLSVGHIDSMAGGRVRSALAAWYSQADDLEFQFAILRKAHADLGAYLEDTVPAHHLTTTHPKMAKHPRSRFPFDQAAVLSDPRLESHLSTYLIRLEFTIGEAQGLLERQSQLPDPVRPPAS